MPRPRLPGAASAPKSTLEKFPDHVSTIGMVSIELANLEIELSHLLGALLHIHPQFSHLVYFTPQSTIARLQILESVANSHLVRGTLGHKKITSLVGKARSVMGRRHDAIHQLWGISTSNPSHVVRRKLPFTEANPAQTVPITQLTDLLEGIRELAQDVKTTTQEAYGSWPPYSWPKKHRGSLTLSQIRGTAPLASEPPTPPPQKRSSRR